MIKFNNNAVPQKYSNGTADSLAHIQAVVEKVVAQGIDLTADYDQWVELGFAFASLGESGRELFHRISSMNAGYKHDDCDTKFSNCCQSSRNAISIATFIQMAKDNGVDVSVAEHQKARSGRPKKSPEQIEQEAKEKADKLQAALRENFTLRFNTWTNRPEVLDCDNRYRPVDNRDICTIATRLQSVFPKIKVSDVRTLIFSRDVVMDYNPVESYLNSLKPWNPDTDPDYIRDFFIGHITFKDPEQTEFYDMVLRKWFVCNVALWLGAVSENPIMPVLTGPQHIGKTYFVNHILPPELRDYIFSANPSARIDKDFVISLAEFAIIFLDEFSFSTNAKSDAYKFIVTSGRSNERDSYAQFRERRDRKAGLIGATNYKRFIKDPEGDRRYPGIDVAGTVSLHDHPLPYEGAYAQALYLIHHGYDCMPTQEESTMISAHNTDYMEPNDCEEVLKTYYRQPQSPTDVPVALTSGAIKQRLNTLGFTGKGFSTVEIGRCMKRLGFEPLRTNCGTKYIAVYVEYEELKRNSKAEAEELLRSREESVSDNATDKQIDTNSNVQTVIDYDQLYSDANGDDSDAPF